MDCYHSRHESCFPPLLPLLLPGTIWFSSCLQELESTVRGISRGRNIAGNVCSLRGFPSSLLPAELRVCYFCLWLVLTGSCWEYVLLLLGQQVSMGYWRVPLREFPPGLMLEAWFQERWATEVYLQRTWMTGNFLFLYTTWLWEAESLSCAYFMMHGTEARQGLTGWLSCWSSHRKCNQRNECEKGH